MGFLDTIGQRISGAMQGAYSWITRTINSGITGTTHSYTAPSDTEEDNEEETGYITQVVCGAPLRETKCLFVPEMNDFYSDAELNTIYHSADEYRNAIKKYGLIYKSQKFQNADTAQKLLDYATDWIKNNYHGGITNFSITALDMHLLGYSVQKYTVGLRVNIIYMDPAVHQETQQTLTVISAEYDLNNPDKNQYKIGIPDVTLNKVYGETSKSGGGGGGGGKASDETDNETNTEVDGLGDDQDKGERKVDEAFWAMFYKGLKDGDDVFSTNEFLTPGQKDETSDWLYGVMADKLSATNIKTAVMDVTKQVKSKYGNFTGGVDTDKLSSNTSNTGRTNATSMDVVGKTTSKEVDVTDKLTSKDLDVTGTMKVNNKTFKVDIENNKPVVYINGTKYVLATQ